MDNETDILSEDYFDLIFYRLTGFKCDSRSIMRLNNEKLSVNGDLYFMTSFKFWKTILGDKLDCHERCTDILQHYAHTRNVNAERAKTAEANEKIVRLLLAGTDAWNFRISKFNLVKERVCLFLDRPNIMKRVIAMVLEEKESFGASKKVMDESVQILFKSDETSEMTSARLHVIKNVCEKLLDLQGYPKVKESATRTIILTSKSTVEEEQYDKCDIYVCGVVKNSQTNTKEKALTVQEYLNAKVKAITELTEQRHLHLGEPVINKVAIEKSAELTTYFELLSVKPSRPVFLNLQTDVDKSLTNTKGFIFIGYNGIRISAILDKLWKGIRSNEYRFLESIADTDFSVLNDEDEWELVFNFLLGYPEAIKNSIRFKPTLKLSPHIVCMFLSRLAQKFSAYYRKTKILTKGAEHLYMRLSARIHMLKALEIVLENGIAILDIMISQILKTRII